jgi:hypothetical protein
MILGMSLAGFTVLHLIISMIAIGLGCGRRRAARVEQASRLDAMVLILTILTSATGFLFSTKLLPSHIVAIISLVLLAIAVYALYGKGVVRIWRTVYIVTAMLALWFNVFVLIAQSFQKVALLNVYAPTGAEPPFAITQGIVLLFFIFLIVLGIRRFRTAQRQRDGSVDESHCLRRDRHGRAGSFDRMPARQRVTHVLTVGRSATGRQDRSCARSHIRTFSISPPLRQILQVTTPAFSVSACRPSGWMKSATAA